MASNYTDNSDGDYYAKKQAELPEVQVFDLTEQPKKNHRWIDRGEKLTCETVTHPYHEIWKRRQPIAQQ